MAHFAQIDDNNVVLNVLVIADEDCQDSDGNESEAVGVAFCQALVGADTNWKQTSYNNNMRTRYAVIGGTYNPTLDAFVNPQPYASWTLNNTTKDWEPPTPDPSDETSLYRWDEDTLSWVEQDIS